jgi:hypothetical protein
MIREERLDEKGCPYEVYTKRYYFVAVPHGGRSVCSLEYDM